MAGNLVMGTAVLVGTTILLLARKIGAQRIVPRPTHDRLGDTVRGVSAMSLHC